MKKVLKFIAVVALNLGLGACAGASIKSAETDAAVTTANYTNDYVNFTLWSPSGVNLGMGGDAKPFASGGAGGTACCIKIPGIGETIQVRARAGGFNDTAARYKTYQDDVVIKGSQPTQPQLYSYLVVRFFLQSSNRS